MKKIKIAIIFSILVLSSNVCFNELPEETALDSLIHANNDIISLKSTVHFDDDVEYLYALTKDKTFYNKKGVELTDAVNLDLAISATSNPNQNNTKGFFRRIDDAKCVDNWYYNDYSKEEGAINTVTITYDFVTKLSGFKYSEATTGKNLKGSSYRRIKVQNLSKEDYPTNIRLVSITPFIQECAEIVPKDENVIGLDNAYVRSSLPFNRIISFTIKVNGKILQLVPGRDFLTKDELENIYFDFPRFDENIGKYVCGHPLLRLIPGDEIEVKILFLNTKLDENGFYANDVNYKAEGQNLWYGDWIIGFFATRELKVLKYQLFNPEDDLSGPDISSSTLRTQPSTRYDQNRSTNRFLMWNDVSASRVPPKTKVTESWWEAKFMIDNNAISSDRDYIRDNLVFEGGDGVGVLMLGSTSFGSDALEKDKLSYGSVAVGIPVQVIKPELLCEDECCSELTGTTECCITD